MTIQESRIKRLNTAPAAKGDYVLYWMQQSQRAEENHALEFALREGNRQGKKVLVAFCLMKTYPEANLRHYTFMLEGLAETRKILADRGVRMIFRIGDPVREILDLGRKACLIVCDRGYLLHQRTWHEKIARRSGCPVVQVETDVVVPVEEASHKAEYAAYTLRPRILRQLERYLRPVAEEKVAHPSLDIRLPGSERNCIEAALENLSIDRSVGPVTRFFKGGTSQAKARFDDFLLHRFGTYPAQRNEPKAMDVSCMSPYLHFGQISPLYLALRVKAVESQYPEAAASFLEELIVRRELAMNFVFFTPSYDTLSCLPDWARKTLSEHERDPRDYGYSRESLSAGRTHDPYWNAAMREMIVTGFMHNYMRMYWGKKILEWSPTPEQGHATLLALNNTYFLDGRDPNSYAGAGWIFGLHDRAWGERPVFGKVRYMAASGLKRKCDIQGYVNRVNRMAAGG